MALREDRVRKPRRMACSVPAQSSTLQLGTWLSLCCAAVCLLCAKPSAFGHKPQKCHSVQLSQGAECPPSPSALTLCAEDGHVVLLGRWWGALERPMGGRASARLLLGSRHRARPTTFTLLLQNGYVLAAVPQKPQRHKIQEKSC